jgi:hypothetical protein
MVPVANRIAPPIGLSLLDVKTRSLTFPPSLPNTKSSGFATAEKQAPQVAIAILPPAVLELIPITGPGVAA